VVWNANGVMVPAHLDAREKRTKVYGPAESGMFKQPVPASGGRGDPGGVGKHAYMGSPKL
jgi:hypothetical protein